MHLVRNNSCDASDLFFLRFYSGLRRPEHDRVRAELEATLIEMATLDAEAIARANRRRELLEKAKRLRDQVWPIIPHHHGRRPPGPDERPLPPLIHDPEPLSGRRLRSACLALLERYGELPLAELHSHLHMHGYVVAGPHGVKRLADALAYEVRRARAVRTKRGCYRRAGGGSTRASASTQLTSSTATATSIPSCSSARNAGTRSYRTCEAPSGAAPRCRACGAAPRATCARPPIVESTTYKKKKYR